MLAVVWFAHTHHSLTMNKLTKIKPENSWTQKQNNKISESLEISKIMKLCVYWPCHINNYNNELPKIEVGFFKDQNWVKTSADIEIGAPDSYTM